MDHRAILDDIPDATSGSGGGGYPKIAYGFDEPMGNGPVAIVRMVALEEDGQFSIIDLEMILPNS